MSYFEIYLIGCAVALFVTVFLLVLHSKDTAKFSFGFKTFFVLLSTSFSWISILLLSANALADSLKRKGK